MNRSLLRFYSISVCAVTAFSVLMIAGLPVWNAALRTKTSIEQHEVYQFLDEANKPCRDCDTLTTLESAPPRASGIPLYQIAPQVVEMEEDLLDTSWIPAPFIIGARILIGLVGILIFLVHWQLYRNLGFVE